MQAEQMLFFMLLNLKRKNQERNAKFQVVDLYVRYIPIFPKLESLTSLEQFSSKFHHAYVSYFVFFCLLI